ncbi:hypothetical protein MSIBF_A1760033 [groundwater metagenome]|uniref:Uncharacterized protein n=1 Tax=groundwater metagenome TaxID=717931 RepID=A0A098E8S8_9ZZZZ
MRLYYKKEEAEEEILKASVLFEKQGKVKGVDLCDEILNNLEFADPMNLDKLFFGELYALQDKF